MNTYQRHTMKTIGIIATVLLTVIASPIWRGFVLSKLWAWFIVTTFGLAPLTIAQAIGLSILVGFATFQHDQYEDKEKSHSDKIIDMVSVSALLPAIALLTGWIVKLFLN